MSKQPSIPHTNEDGDDLSIKAYDMHELTDRLFAMSSIYDSLITEHPAAFIVQEYSEKISQLLFDAYQFAAKVENDTFPD